MTCTGLVGTCQSLALRDALPAIWSGTTSRSHSTAKSTATAIKNHAGQRARSARCTSLSREPAVARPPMKARQPTHITEARTDPPEGKPAKEGGQGSDEQQVDQVLCHCLVGKDLRPLSVDRRQGRRG